MIVYGDDNHNNLLHFARTTSHGSSLHAYVGNLLAYNMTGSNDLGDASRTWLKNDSVSRYYRRARSKMMDRQNGVRVIWLRQTAAPRIGYVEVER
jgi:hypothetical protein